MRALYYDGSGGLEWRDLAMPVIEAASDALVRPIAVATCDLDQAIIHGSVPGSEQPFAIGHEGVGEVYAVGDAITTLAVGDIVAIPYHISCGQCDRCLEGLPLFCRASARDALAVFGIPIGEDYGGLFSEVLRVPFADYSLLKLPPGLSPLHAVSVGDNLTDVWRALVPHLQRRPGSDVLIMGKASMGLYGVDVARACGARRIRYVDRDPARLALAERLGAESTSAEHFSPDECDYDITLVTHGNPVALRNALLATAPGGHCENLGFHFTEIQLPLLAMHMKCVHFRSALSNARPYMPAVLELLSSGRLHPELIRTDLLPFDTAAEALPTAGFKPVFERDPAHTG